MDTQLMTIGVLLTLGTVVWALTIPELFLLQIVVLACGLFFCLIGGIGVLTRPPPWLLGGMIVFAFCMMDFSIRRGGVQPGGFDIQSLAKGGVWCVVLLFGAVHGAKHAWQDKALRFFLFYAVFAFASAFYSKSFGLGLGSGVALLGLAMYGGLMSQWGPDRVISTWRNLFIALSVIAAISVVLYFALPEWARDFKAAGSGRLRGLTGSGNSLGPLVAVASLIGLFLLRSTSHAMTRVLYFCLVVVDLSALVLTQSRSAMIAVCGAVMLTMGLRRPILFPFFGAAGTVGFWLLSQPEFMRGVLAGLANMLARSGNIAEITSFTGRDKIWGAVIDLWHGSPWIGFGLGSPRVLISEVNISRWQSYESAHNWLLESLLSVGVAGTALLVAFLCVVGARTLKLFYQAQRIPPAMKKPADLIPVCLLQCFLFALLNGMTEKAFAGIPNPSTVLLVLIASSCCQVATYGKESKSLHSARLAA